MPFVALIQFPSSVYIWEDTLLGCVIPPGVVPAEDSVGAQVLEVRACVGTEESHPTSWSCSAPTQLPHHGIPLPLVQRGNRPGEERATRDLIAEPVRPYTEDRSTFPFNPTSTVNGYILNDL